mgnify:CR=1 FL=1
MNGNTSGAYKVGWNEVSVSDDPNNPGGVVVEGGEGFLPETDSSDPNYDPAKDLATHPGYNDRNKRC